jgi:preprotein translocase subunit SecD
MRRAFLKFAFSSLILPLVVANTAASAQTSKETVLKVRSVKVTDTVLTIFLDDDSSIALMRVTSENIGRFTQVLIDGKEVLRPKIYEPIMNGILQISGVKKDYAERVSRDLPSGQAKLSLRPDN